MENQKEINGKDHNSPCIAISAGGTGGHMFPASAVAMELANRNYRVILLTDERGMKFAGNFDQCEIFQIDSGHLGGGIKNKLKSIFKLLKGIITSVKILKKSNVDTIIGFGGYPSFPPLFAGVILRKKIVLHEQNAVLGKANAFMAKFANRVALSFDGMNIQSRNKDKYIVTGNPVRQEIEKLYTSDYTPPKIGGSFNLLIFGGSLGASVFSELIPQAVNQLPPELKRKINIVQQCREDEKEDLIKKYSEMGVDAKISTFFDNMAELIEWSHLVICRSGASTVSEISISARPAIFVPYPYHKDNQQKANAEIISKSGGAWCIDQGEITSEDISEILAEAMNNPELLSTLSASSRLKATPNATSKLCDFIVA